jgi:NodT family efflux transporter outer membrane factor (OMF) lipoprotein
MSFFEKKNQETFATWHTLPASPAPNDNSFLLLFFKKEVLPFLCIALLSGCDLAPAYHVPVLHVATSYKEAGAWHVATPADAAPRGPWWQMFGDPVLNGLEAQVDTGNPSLAASLASFQQARAIAAEAYAGIFPTLSLGGQVTTNRQSNRRPLRGANEPNQYLANTIDVQANYEIDFWGRIANAVRAGRAAAQASAADLAFARLSLHAELANDYVTLRGLDAQAHVLTDAVQAYDRALDITQARYAGKIAPRIDVTRAQTQYHDAQASLTDTAARRALIEHAIAVLIGKQPAELTIPDARWSLREAHVPPGLPSTLLERRPDIASAERLVASANATIGETRAAFYPTISLNLLYGLQDTGFNLFSLPNDMWSVGPGLVMPLFEGGLRNAEEAAAMAAYRQTVANYRATVLAAFQDVEDALSQLRLLAQETGQEQLAVDAARQTVAMTTNLYKDGATNFLDVVVAQTAELQAEQTDVDLRTRRMQACVALVQALGGGWTRSDMPALKKLMANAD